MGIGITIAQPELIIGAVAFGQCQIVGVDISPVIGEIIAEDTIGTRGVGDNYKFVPTIKYSSKPTNRQIANNGEKHLADKRLHPTHGERAFMQPTVLIDMKSDNPVYYEELFRPVANFIG